jgi:Ca-activated chloride channel homolog
MSAVSGLSFLPVAPWPVLALFAVVALALVWWPAGPRERAESKVARGRRTAMVVLLLVAALRPAVPGHDVRVDASAVDVYFVVDTTSSVMARDYAEAQPRLDGVRTDIKAVVNQLTGARFALMTFDIDTTLRLPLTSDGAAVGAAAETLRPETSVWSRGSSITLAREQLRSALERGRDTHPERARLVFYLGDGEQTAAQDPRPFDIDGQLVNGGAVLGYGTAAGGRMAITAAFEKGDIVDPSTGQPALSVIDEKQLAAVANQLGVPYVHRTSDDNGLGVVEAVKLKELAPLRATDSAEIVGGRSELGWVALLLVALLAAWEIGSLVAAVSRSRRPARPSAPAGSAVSPPAGMRLAAALRPIRSRRRGSGAAGSAAGSPAAPRTPGRPSTPLASPFDPTAQPDVEPTTTGGRR